MPGFARPIRDDVLDRQPHGTIDLHRALVVSCNAYFAQLAVKLGPQALLAVAQPADISLARNNAVARIRDTLPQVGYGQGEVVASPLRMAAIAAAIALIPAILGRLLRFVACDFFHHFLHRNDVRDGLGAFSANRHALKRFEPYRAIGLELHGRHLQQL